MADSAERRGATDNNKGILDRFGIPKTVCAIEVISDTWDPDYAPDPYDDPTRLSDPIAQSLSVRASVAFAKGKTKTGQELLLRLGEHYASQNPDPTDKDIQTGRDMTNDITRIAREMMRVFQPDYTEPS